MNEQIRNPTEKVRRVDKRLAYQDERFKKRVTVVTEKGEWMSAFTTTSLGKKYWKELRAAFNGKDYVTINKFSIQFL